MSIYEQFPDPAVRDTVMVAARRLAPSAQNKAISELFLSGPQPDDDLVTTVHDLSHGYSCSTRCKDESIARTSCSSTGIARPPRGGWPIQLPKQRT